MSFLSSDINVIDGGFIIPVIYQTNEILSFASSIIFVIYKVEFVMWPQMTSIHWYSWNTSNVICSRDMWKNVRTGICIGVHRLMCRTTFPWTVSLCLLYHKDNRYYMSNCYPCYIYYCCPQYLVFIWIDEDVVEFLLVLRVIIAYIFDHEGLGVFHFKIQTVLN